MGSYKVLIVVYDRKIVSEQRLPMGTVKLRFTKIMEHFVPFINM